MTHRVIVFLLASCGIAVPLDAQQMFLPLKQVVQRVTESDPGLRAREIERQAAGVETKRAETQRWPKVYLQTDAGGGHLINDVANVLLTGLTPVAVTNPDTRSRLAGLSLTRPFFLPGARVEEELFDGGQTSAAIRTARLNEDKAEVARKRTLDDEAYDTASDFLGVAYGQVLGHYLDEYSHVAETASQALTDQARAGRITDVQALTGNAKLQAARSAVDNNRDDVLTATALLRRRAGVTEQAAFDTREFEAWLSDFTLAAMPQELNVQSNFYFQDASLDARMQLEEVRTAKGRLIPNVRLEGEYGFTFSGEVFSFRPSYTLGVRASYPLFSGRELERNLRAQSLRSDAARLKQEKTAVMLQAQQARMHAERRRLERQYQAARSQLTQAEEVYRVARLKYDQGAGSPSDLLEAAELLFTERQQCLELSRSSWLMRWNALRFQGELLSELEGGTHP